MPAPSRIAPVRATRTSVREKFVVQRGKKNAQRLAQFA